LGGTDIQIEGLWAWSRGNDPFIYKNWQTGQPDNNGGKENCVDSIYINGVEGTVVIVIVL
jgi:hypothetical protein